MISAINSVKSNYSNIKQQIYTFDKLEPTNHDLTHYGLILILSGLLRRVSTL